MLSSSSPPINIKDLNSVYRTPFKDDLIRIIQDKLVLYKSISRKEKYVYHCSIWSPSKNIHSLPCWWTYSVYAFHVDLWQPGIQTTSWDETYYAFNCMCDLIQFVFSTIVTDPTSSSLAKAFMEQVVLSYCMVAAVIVDADSYMVLFAQCVACKILHIGY